MHFRETYKGCLQRGNPVGYGNVHNTFRTFNANLKLSPPTTVQQICMKGSQWSITEIRRIFKHTCEDLSYSKDSPST